MHVERHTRLALTTTLLALGCLGGCSIWFLANQDPAGLPCADTSPFCLDTYTCVDGLCLKAAALGEGQECRGDEECEDELVCTNAYNADECGVDINCELGRTTIATADTLRCHRTCNPNGVLTDECALGERCHPDLTGRADGWCQAGTCTTPTDCGGNAVNAAQNICIGGDANPGGNTPGSGLCLEGCDPLQCQVDVGCFGCTQTQNPTTGGLNAMGCEPFLITSNVACIEAGGVAHDGICDNVTTFCSAGSWCNIPQGAASGFCSKWCRLGGGAPACNAAHPNCNAVAGAVFGFCS